MDESLSLYELNQLIRHSLEHCMPDDYWIEAELSEVRSNKNGICYVEFVQNDEKAHRSVAKANGIIWSQTYALLKSYFEETTQQAFVAGIKVRVQVSVNFHELYGFSLIVKQIDPNFTLGDMALRRQKILYQLQKEGVIDLNKELLMPILPQRVAVISSNTAAGYGDFCNQLQNNEGKFFFRIELFQALMQGNQVEQSILEAMQAVISRIEEFDVLVIIRGGGSTAELSCFDNYLLAAAVSQFPIPVIVGIGHERDETVLDKVAHTSVKTPTAVAAFLIDKMEEAARHLAELSETLHDKMLLLLNTEQLRLHRLQLYIPTKVLQRLSAELSNVVSLKKDVENAARNYLNGELHRLALYGEKIADLSPQKIMAKGYSMTMCGGKMVKDVSKLQRGDKIETYLSQGTIYSNVEKAKK